MPRALKKEFRPIITADRLNEAGTAVLTRISVGAAGAGALTTPIAAPLYRIDRFGYLHFSLSPVTRGNTVFVTDKTLIKNNEFILNQYPVSITWRRGVVLIKPHEKAVWILCGIKGC